MAEKLDETIKIMEKVRAAKSTAEELDSIKLGLATLTATIMTLDKERKASGVSRILNVVGGVSGLLSVLALVFWGGQLVNRVNAHELRLTNIEVSGSVGFKEHAALDDERERNQKARMIRVEEGVLAIPRIEAKLDSLKDEVRAMKGTK